MVALATVLVPSVLQARWSGSRDNKARSDLVTLTDKELFNDAFDVCIQRAFLEKAPDAASQLSQAAIADASDYLATISAVLGERHGDTVPAWMTQLSAAHKVKECQAGFHAFLGGEAAPTKRPVPTPQRQRPIKLPPWLAPPAE